MKSTCRISWAGNILVLLDLTFGTAFKVKRWFTGFGDCLSGGYNFIFGLHNLANKKYSVMS